MREGERFRKGLRDGKKVQGNERKGAKKAEKSGTRTFQLCEWKGSNTFSHELSKCRVVRQ